MKSPCVSWPNLIWSPHSTQNIMPKKQNGASGTVALLLKHAAFRVPRALETFIWDGIFYKYHSTTLRFCLPALPVRGLTYLRLTAWGVSVVPQGKKTWAQSQVLKSGGTVESTPDDRLCSLFLLSLSTGEIEPALTQSSGLSAHEQASRWALIT